MNSKPAGESREDRDRRRLRLAKLQADMAYFQARLGLIGDPQTLGQAAQRRTFKLLHQAIGARLVEARRARGER